ncbi:unnamed protein product [Musa acuminata subsp. malaccensis]|uniref:(wild Malaysian banana) hypothetical protein n=1 Tax=Musa acuminata subsp. malaccensis TaxID=214687 RepID=A0A804KU92_MUSAM|nr:PREDICTED: uncharacterized protein LOC104000421 isoform X1 [Musa acuminata subsp. malaccensis]CAG1852986.1 unnamed protein product [Musa acuminata subsp. malaccensis]
MGSYGLIGETSRPRRARRLGRAWKRRCSLWLFSLSLISLVYLAFFGARLPFDSLHHGHVNERIFANEVEKSKMRHANDYISEDINTLLEGQGSHASLGKEISVNKSNFRNLGFASDIKNNLSHARADSQLEGSKHSRAKSRKRHVPCEVGFAESVDNLVEPENYLNFTKFSLEYITKEETSNKNVVIEPRFGGHQTLEQREKSFYARNQTIYCGFVQAPEGYRGTGFDLSEKDGEYMASCIVVVSSCIFGNSDFLRRPTSSKIGTYSKKNVCFMMFLDELTLKKLSSEGHVPDDMGNIGLWRIIVVKNLPYADMRKTGKVPKFLSHRLFPSARFSIWIDSKMRLHADPMLILEYFLWRTRSEYAISNHYDRHCVWEEVLQNKRLNKYNHTVIDQQFMFYQSDGLSKFNESEHSSILPSFVPEGSFIVRAHTPMSNLFSCLWFNEVNRFTSRDQLSFAYTFLKLKRMNPGRPFYLNMFKDCERRAIGKLFHHKLVDHSSPVL